jgi:hypothetical protein
MCAVSSFSLARVQVGLKKSRRGERRTAFPNISSIPLRHLVDVHPAWPSLALNLDGVRRFEETRHKRR